ncbi:hypothetical protein PFISCL1PPCAC_7939, partial [Pristionchus fissidentatus]
FYSMVAFDHCQTIMISVVLMITLPIAFLVYAKLCFVQPYAINYTFKLIAFNGITELLSCVTFLLCYQLATYQFMYGFYQFLIRNNLVRTLTTLDNALSGCALHSALFVSLNRLKTIITIKRKGNDSSFFVISMVLCILLTLPQVMDFCTTSRTTYLTFPEYSVLIPKTIETDTVR